MSAFYSFGGFLFCALLIVLSGTRLSKYGDIISDKLNLGKAWFGLVFLSAVTTLPEMITGISAAAIVQNPDLVAGNVMGSCAFNLMLLSVLDFFAGKIPITSRVKGSHIIVGGFIIIQLCLLLISLIFSNRIPVFGHIGAFSFVAPLIYLSAMFIIFSYEKREMGKSSLTAAGTEHDLSLKKAVGLYSVNAVVVISAAVFLPHFGDQIAEITGLGSLVVGTFMLAVSTSLPEITISISAIRRNSYEIAVGNLFGSTLYNLLILALADFFYTKGALTALVSTSNIISAICVIMMTAVAAIGLTFKRESKRFVFATDTLVILLIYLLMFWVLINF